MVAFAGDLRSIGRVFAIDDETVQRVARIRHEVSGGGELRSLGSAVQRRIEIAQVTVAVGGLAEKTPARPHGEREVLAQAEFVLAVKLDFVLCDARRDVTAGL